MSNHPEKKPSGRHYFTQLKASAENYSDRSAIAARHVEQPKHLDRPTSGAEITEINSPEKHRFSLRTALRSFGKKREQTGISKPVGRFVPEEPVMDDSGEDENTVILERGMSALLRQDAATRPDTAARRQDTTESQGYNATKAVRQTAIISSSSVPDTRFEINLFQQPLKPTFFDNVARPFFDNVAPPFFRTPLPELNKCFSSTLQLAFARHLLLTKKMSRSSSKPASLSTVEDSTQAMGLEGTDLLWMRAISKDPIEQDRLCRLTSQVAFQFLESNYKDAKSIAEVILLGSVLDRQDYRGVLSSLIRQLEQEPLLESAVLVGVVYFLESAPLGYLIDDDLVRILRVLRKRLEYTHMQPGDTKKPASEPIYPLAIAISRVLDKMVQGNIKGLRRTEDHRPLLNILAGLKDSPNLSLKYQATCAWQALQYIGDDEPPLDMVVRVGGGLVMAGLGVASAFKLDIEGLFNGLRELGEAAGQIRDATETVIASVQTAREAGEGVLDSLSIGFRTGNKRAWYPALQGARVVISEGRLAEFRRIVYEAPCCRVQEFQWGICQLLGEIAMDPIWVMEIRLQAVYFLEELLRSDSEWTTDSSVMDAIRSILLRISTSREKTIQIHFNSLSQDSRRENGDDSEEPYLLITRLPTPGSSPLLAKALKAPSLEYDLHRVMAQRLEAYQQAAYIPPYAKANLTASDERFPLMEKVMEFLKSDRQVFLILGDSGSGKTTFNRHLEHVLTKGYKQGNPIPMFIYLPAIRNPEKELVSEHLKTLNFTDNDIQELKQDRQFIIICDSYDESRLKINLHMTNMLNQRGQWKVKLIISCRSTHPSANRLHHFQPQPSPVDRYSPSTLHLFQQAVIVPFSEGQIKDYVDQFVRDTELHRVLGVQSVWSTAEYMDKLTRIPNLLALVTNPFLLSLSLRSLPVAFKDDLDPSTIAKMTRPKLYGIFIDEWLKVNIHRLLCMNHNEATTTKLNELIEAGFNQIAIDFLQNLAKAIYKEQAGNSVVRYVHRDDKGTWKAKFFGPDEEITLLRQSSPLTCVENLHSFIHRSLLEYFCSLQMAKIAPTINKRENEQVETRPRSMSQTTNLQTDLLQEHSTTNDQRKHNNPPSSSLTPSLHQNTQHIMAFSISNALDSGSSFTSTNFLANTLERNTLRDACADTTLDVESDGSVSSDDEFEDAQEFLSGDLFECITQDEPHKTIESAKAAFQVTYRERFGVEWEERETTVSESFTYEVKTYETFESTEEIEEIVEETAVVDQPAVPKGSSWFRRVASAIGAAVVGAGAVAVGAGTFAIGAVHGAASGAGHAAHSALEKVKDVWKRTVQVLTTRKAHVDSVAPITKTPYVYYDDEVYDAVLTEKSTGVTYVTQLLYDTTTTTKYYDYVRWGETDYKLEGPYKTVESAKAAFHATYREQFGLQWEERETAVSERFAYEVKTYETFEETEEIEEVIEETEAAIIIDREKEVATEDEVNTTETTTTTTTEDETILEHVEKDVMVDKVEVDVDVSVEVDVEVEKKESKEVIITKETDVVDQPAVPKGSSWFRRVASATGAAAVGAGAVAVGAGALAVGAGALAVGAGALAVGAVHGAASGAGHAAHGALEKVDGVWKRTVQVLTTRKAHVDSVAPIAKTSYVYYDDEVYDAVLVEKSTGVTYVTQLLYDTTTTKYYVYIRWCETDYRLDGPHETVESAKAAFQTTYHDQFGVQWEERETTVSERFTYEVKTYETFETTEEIEEIVEETEAVAIIAREQETVSEEKIVQEVNISTVQEDIVVEQTQKKNVIVEDEVQTKETVIAAVVDETIAVETSLEEVVESVAVTEEQQIVKEVVIQKETGVIVEPAVTKQTSWFRRAIDSAGTAVGAAAVDVGAVAIGTGALALGAGALAVGAVHDVASGAGHAAHGALEKVDGVWKRTVQVLTTRKAHVDSVAPIAKTSYVYYDDEVYDAVLVEKSTGVTYVTQLLFDSTTNVYYIYVRWGETDYKLDGPHETVEAAKAAFKVTYHDQFGVQWQERETTVSERFTYEVKTYETFETVEVVEEVVDEKVAEVILKREQEIVDEETVQTETTTSTTITHQEEGVSEIAYEVEVVDGEEITKVITTTKETGVVAQPAVTKSTSWLRRLATGAGAAAAGALTQVDGVWKRSVQVLTTRKAHVDTVAPIAKTSYVYYDEDVYDAVLVEKSTGFTYVTQLLYNNADAKYYVYIRWGETSYKLNGPHETVESAKAAFQITYREQFGVQWEQRETTVSERFTYEIKTYETIEEIEEIEEVVEDYEVSEVVAQEKVVIEGERVISTHQSITSSHDDTIVRNVSEQVLFKEGAAVDDSAKLSRTQYETLTRVDSSTTATSAAGTGALFGGAAAILGGAAAAGAIHHGGASSTTVVEETKKAIFDFSSLPVLLGQAIDVQTGASVGVIDLTSGTTEAYRELPCHLRPPSRVFARKLYEHLGEELPADLSVERLCGLGDDGAKGEVVDEVETAPSLSFPKCEISGIPESLGDLTTANLVFEMGDSPMFDDESLGAMDLEEEQDILQFLVEQVHEDTDYTKRLLWTVYKSLTEGIINQSTKNATSILEKAGIRFQPQLRACDIV